MIPIIIHNFFPLAAELLAGLVLFACLFDACCVTLCEPQCPSHTSSHIITPFFFTVMFLSLSLFLWFSISGFISQSSCHFVPLTNKRQLTTEWIGAHTIKWHTSTGRKICVPQMHQVTNEYQPNSMKFSHTNIILSDNVGSTLFVLYLYFWIKQQKKNKKKCDSNHRHVGQNAFNEGLLTS